MKIPTTRFFVGFFIFRSHYNKDDLYETNQDDAWNVMSRTVGFVLCPLLNRLASWIFNRSINWTIRGASQMNLRPVTFVLGGPFQVFPEHLWSTPLNIYQQDIFLDSFHKKLGWICRRGVRFWGKSTYLSWGGTTCFRIPSKKNMPSKVGHDQKPVSSWLEL